MQNSAWSFHEWLSRLVAGGAAGCGLLLLADLLFILPAWGPRLLKGDERGETVVFIAKFGLPASFAAGAMAGLAWRRSREFRLLRLQLISCCLAVALVSQLLRPAVSRVRSGGVGPLYEVVPDTLAAIMCLVAAAVVVCRPDSRRAGQEA